MLMKHCTKMRVFNETTVFVRHLWGLSSYFSRNPAISLEIAQIRKSVPVNRCTTLPGLAAGGPSTLLRKFPVLITYVPESRLYVSQSLRCRTAVVRTNVALVRNCVRPLGKKSCFFFQAGQFSQCNASDEFDLKLERTSAWIGPSMYIIHISFDCLFSRIQLFQFSDALCLRGRLLVCITDAHNKFVHYENLLFFGNTISFLQQGFSWDK